MFHCLLLYSVGTGGTGWDGGILLRIRRLGVRIPPSAHLRRESAGHRLADPRVFFGMAKFGTQVGTDLADSRTDSRARGAHVPTPGPVRRMAVALAGVAAPRVTAYRGHAPLGYDGVKLGHLCAVIPPVLDSDGAGSSASGFQLCAGRGPRAPALDGPQPAAAAKENEGAQHPDRDAQFRHLNAQVEAHLAALARSCCRLADWAIADFGQPSHGAATARSG